MVNPVSEIKVPKTLVSWKFVGLYSNTKYQASISSVSKMGSGKATLSKIESTISPGRSSWTTQTSTLIISWVRYSKNLFSSRKK